MLVVVILLCALLSWSQEVPINGGNDDTPSGSPPNRGPIAVGPRWDAVSRLDQEPYASDSRIIVPQTHPSDIYYDANTPNNEGELCESAVFLVKILNLFLPLLANNLSGPMKTTYILNILKYIVNSSPSSVQHEELTYKINDLLTTLEKYDIDFNIIPLQENTINSKMSFNIEVPMLPNPDCTAELLAIIRTVQDSILRLVNNPICKKVVTTYLPAYDVNSILSNPTKHLILQNLIPPTENLYIQDIYKQHYLPQYINAPDINIYTPQNLPYQNILNPSKEIYWPKGLIKIINNSNGTPIYIDDESPNNHPVHYITENEDIPDKLNVEINQYANPMNPQLNIEGNPGYGYMAMDEIVPEPNKIFPRPSPIITYKEVPDFNGMPLTPQYVDLQYEDTSNFVAPKYYDTEPINLYPQYDSQDNFNNYLSDIVSITPRPIYFVDDEQNRPRPKKIKPDSPYHYDASPTSIPIINGVPLFPSEYSSSEPEEREPDNPFDKNSENYLKPNGKRPKYFPFKLHYKPAESEFDELIPKNIEIENDLLWPEQHGDYYNIPEYYYNLNHGIETNPSYPVDAQNNPLYFIYNENKNKPVYPNIHNNVKLTTTPTPQPNENIIYIQEKDFPEIDTSPDKGQIYSHHIIELLNPQEHDVSIINPPEDTEKNDDTLYIESPQSKIDDDREFSPLNYEEPKQKIPLNYISDDHLDEGNSNPFTNENPWHPIYDSKNNHLSPSYQKPKIIQTQPTEFMLQDNNLLVNKIPWLPFVIDKNSKPYLLNPEQDTPDDIVVFPIKPTRPQYDVTYEDIYPISDVDKYPRPSYLEHPDNSEDIVIVPTNPTRPQNDVVVPEEIDTIDDKNSKPSYTLHPEQKNIEGLVVFPSKPDQPENKNVVSEQNYSPFLDIIKHQPLPDYPTHSEEDSFEDLVFSNEPIDYNFVIPNNYYPGSDKIHYQMPIYPSRPEQKYSEDFVVLPSKATYPEHNIVIAENNYYPLSDIDQSPMPNHNPTHSDKSNIEAFPIKENEQDDDLPHISNNVPEQPIYNDIQMQPEYTVIMDNQNYEMISGRPDPQSIEVPKGKYPSQDDLVNVITEELHANINPTNDTNFIIKHVVDGDDAPSISYQLQSNDKLLLLVKDNINMLENKVPNIHFNINIHQCLETLKDIINHKIITIEDYATVVNQYEKLIEYIKHLNINNEILKVLLATMTNVHQSIHQSGKSNVIELTYLVKRPTPVVYQPYYYVKYRLPYKSFKQTVQQLLIEKPYVNNNPAKLYRELIALFNVAETSPDLEDYEKEDIFKLTFSDGTLIAANVVKANDLDMYSELNLLKEISSENTLDDTIKLIKNAQSDRVTIEKNVNDASLNPGINIQLNINRNRNEQEKMTSRDMINNILEKVNSLRTQINSIENLDSETDRNEYNLVQEENDVQLDDQESLSEAKGTKLDSEEMGYDDINLLRGFINDEIRRDDLSDSTSTVYEIGKQKANPTVGEKLLEATIEASVKNGTDETVHLDYDYSPLNPENIDNHLDDLNEASDDTSSVPRSENFNLYNVELNPNLGKRQTYIINSRPESVGTKLIHATIEAKHPGIHFVQNNQGPIPLNYLLKPGNFDQNSGSHQYSVIKHQYGPVKVIQRPAMVKHTTYTYTLPGSIHRSDSDATVDTDMGSQAEVLQS